MLPIVFMSNEQGAPTLNNAAGSLISVLDACLVTGFNSVGITSVTIAGNVATVVTSAAHGLTAGMRGTVAGVSITAANGDKTVASAPTTTSFTYPCVNPDVSESPASASVKRTPLRWAKQFSKTNVTMYKSSDPAAYGQSLRVDDTNGATGARVFGVENPTGIDAWGDRFPTETQYAGGGYWPKGANTAAAKAWCIVGDERIFYLLVENSAYTTSNYPGSSGSHQYWSFELFGFGDIVSNKPGEAFGTVIGFRTSDGTNNSSGSYMAFHTSLGSTPPTSGFYIARQHTGVAKSVSVCTAYPGGSVPGSTQLPRYPSPVANELSIAEPAFVSESLPYANNPIRGVLPGVAAFLCNMADLPSGPLPQKLTTTDGSNRTYLYVPYVATSYPNLAKESCFAVKLNEPWR